MCLTGSRRRDDDCFASFHRHGRCASEEEESIAISLAVWTKAAHGDQARHRRDLLADAMPLCKLGGSQADTAQSHLTSKAQLNFIF